MFKLELQSQVFYTKGYLTFVNISHNSAPKKGNILKDKTAIIYITDITVIFVMNIQEK